MIEVARSSGAFKATELAFKRSLNNNLFDVATLPLIVTFPSTVVAPDFTVPVVLITVAPAITDEPLMVLAVTSAPSKVLFVKVSIALRVTTVPVVGKVAFELIPVPPEVVGNRPVTAVGWDKLIALKYGAPPPLGTVKL